MSGVLWVRYVGPIGQLRGRSGQAMVARQQDCNGCVPVQFDDMELVVAGAPMACGWHPIKRKYLREIQMKNGA